jgi:hypothetical protein
MARNTKQTNPTIASKAAATLADPNASAIARSLAASALVQAGTGKQTGAEMEEKAAKVLQSEKYSDDTKSLAGAVLSQANKER